MQPGSTQYTIVGFCPELDWRPLSFLKPIPPHRVCSACGLVRKRSALLPCMHTLCESCCEQCVQEGLLVCPLDDHECHDEDDVDWKDFPVGQLLRKEVQCWNAENGCQHVAAASKIAQHFQRECLHHSTYCLKCSASVLCSDVCTHLKSGSCGAFAKASLESRRQAEYKGGNASLNAFGYAFQKEAREIKGYMKRMSVDVSMYGDRLNEIAHNMNSFEEALTHELATAVKCPDTLKETLRELSESNAEMKEYLRVHSDAVGHIPAEVNRLEEVLKDGGEKTLERITKVATLAQLQTSRCEFFVPGVKSLQEALRKGLSGYFNERVYLRGYCISLGLKFKNGDDSVTLHVRLALHKGDMDDVVLWPFEHKIRLSVVHPKDGVERDAVVKPYRSINAYQKPGSASNSSLFFTVKWFDLGELRKGGFIENDIIRVKWELLP